MTLEFLTPVPDAVAASPIEPWLRAAGARFEVRHGWRVAMSVGDPAAEDDACRSGAGIADRSAYDVSTLARLGRIDHGRLRSKSVAAFSTRCPRASSRTDIRQGSSIAIRTARQSGAGTTSSSISQIRSKPWLYAASVPARKPPEPPVFVSRWMRCRVSPVWSSRISRVWSVLALSTTMTASG